MSYQYPQDDGDSIGLQCLFIGAYIGLIIFLLIQ